MKRRTSTAICDVEIHPHDASLAGISYGAAVERVHFSGVRLSDQLRTVGDWPSAQKFLDFERSLARTLENAGQQPAVTRCDPESARW